MATQNEVISQSSKIHTSLQFGVGFGTGFQLEILELNTAPSPATCLDFLLRDRDRRADRERRPRERDRERRRERDRRRERERRREWLFEAARFLASGLLSVLRRDQFTSKQDGDLQIHLVSNHSQSIHFSCSAGSWQTGHMFGCLGRLKTEDFDKLEPTNHSKMLHWTEIMNWLQYLNGFVL